MEGLSEDDEHVDRKNYIRAKLSEQFQPKFLVPAFQQKNNNNNNNCVTISFFRPRKQFT